MGQTEKQRMDEERLAKTGKSRESPENPTNQDHSGDLLTDVMKTGHRTLNNTSETKSYKTKQDIVLN